jgi:hypothetical protein
VGPNCQLLLLLLFKFFSSSPILPTRRCSPWPELRPRPAIAGVRSASSAPGRISWDARARARPWPEFAAPAPAPRRSWGARRSWPSDPRAVTPAPSLERQSLRAHPPFPGRRRCLEKPAPLALPHRDHRGARPELGKMTLVRSIYGAVARFLSQRCYGRGGGEANVLSGTSRSSERRRFDDGHG